MVCQCETCGSSPCDCNPVGDLEKFGVRIDDGGNWVVATKTERKVEKIIMRILARGKKAPESLKDASFEEVAAHFKPRRRVTA
jgi:hypothetical protein